MSAAAMNRPIGTRPSIFAQPAIQSSRPTIRRRAGAGATSTKSYSIFRTSRRRISERFPDTIDMRARAKRDAAATLTANAD
jgi:hypothetical protein